MYKKITYFCQESDTSTDPYSSLNILSLYKLLFLFTSYHPLVWQGELYFLKYLCITSLLSAWSLLPPTSLICNTERLMFSASCLPSRTETMSKWSKMAKCKVACNWSCGCTCEKKLHSGRTAPFSAVHPHLRGRVLLRWVTFSTCSFLNIFSMTGKCTDMIKNWFWFQILVMIHPVTKQNLSFKVHFVYLR